MHIRTCLCLLAFVPAGLAQTEEPRTTSITLGDVSIELPAPEGFQEVHDIAPEVWRTQDVTTPPENRQLAVFLADEDVEKVRRGDTPWMIRYMVVQTDRSLEMTRVNAGAFRRLKEKSRAHFDTLQEAETPGLRKALDTLSTHLSSETDLSITMQPGEISPMGIFRDSEDAIGYSYLMRYTLTMGGDSIPVTVAGGATTLLVNDRVLYIHVYSAYRSPEDIDWVRDSSTAWAAAVLAANVGSGGFLRSTDPVVRGAIIGSVVGAVAGAFAVLALRIVRKKRS